MNEFTCYHEDGSVDFFTSKGAYKLALDAWAHKREVEYEKVQGAVDSVLKAAGDSRVAMSKLVNMVLVNLQPTLEEYDEKQKSVEEFVKRNTASEKNPNALYSTQKGKGGGYSLNSAPTNEDSPKEG